MRYVVAAAGVAGVLFAGMGSAAAAPLTLIENADGAAAVQPSAVADEGSSGSATALGAGLLNGSVESGSAQNGANLFWKSLCTISSGQPTAPGTIPIC
ncbi:hypothetical protein [Nocardia sp. NPDC005978]|uniref:hypothetical protein n=1 Tax=unclassified Nocardia TaxID=2637762 RepID=UPI0033BD36E9